MNYELYHDESKEGGYWHGMLLVPEIQKEQLINFLEEARKNTNYQYPISIKQVKNHGPVYNCANSWISIGVGFNRSLSKNVDYQVDLGEKEKGIRNYKILPNYCLGVKFILFCERDNHTQMNLYSDHASKIETTFRMGIKGGLHFLGEEEEPINITKMHFDGYEHYRRHLDKDRIVGRLNGLRNYCSIETRDDFIDDRSSDHRRDNSQEYNDCQLLQLTDLLLGCYRTLLGPCTRNIHKKLAYPVNEILKRYNEGYARMQNSRWRNSLWMSQCYLDNNQWKFETIIKSDNNVQQMDLFL